MNHIGKLTRLKKGALPLDKNDYMKEKPYMKPNYYKLPIPKYTPVIRGFFFFFSRNIYP